MKTVFQQLQGKLNATGRIPGRYYSNKNDIVFFIPGHYGKGQCTANGYRLDQGSDFVGRYTTEVGEHTFQISISFGQLNKATFDVDTMTVDELMVMGGSYFITKEVDDGCFIFKQDKYGHGITFCGNEKKSEYVALQQRLSLFDILNLTKAQFDQLREHEFRKGNISYANPNFIRFDTWDGSAHEMVSVSNNDISTEIPLSLYSEFYKRGLDSFDDNIFREILMRFGFLFFDGICFTPTWTPEFGPSGRNETSCDRSCPNYGVVRVGLHSSFTKRKPFTINFLDIFGDTAAIMKWVNEYVGNLDREEKELDEAIERDGIDWRDLAEALA